MGSFNLSGLIAGAGQGMADVGKTMVATGAQLSLEQERAKVQDARDERLKVFTTSERVAGESFKSSESALERGQKERLHKDTSVKDENKLLVEGAKLKFNELRMVENTIASTGETPDLLQQRKDLREALANDQKLIKERLSGAAAPAGGATPPEAGRRNWRDYAPGAKPKDEAVPAVEPAPVATKPATAPKQEAAAKEPEPATPDQRQLDTDRLKEIEKILVGKDLDFWEGGIIKQMRGGGRYLSPGERKTLERERALLQKKLTN